MNQQTQPAQQPKELARNWLAHEVAQHRPPPDIDQIRRELGWGLTNMNRSDRLP